MSAQTIPHFTPEQYIEIERAADFRSEYFDGRMFAMSGGTYVHARLITSLTGEIYQALRNRPCSVTSSELRVRTAEQGLFTYPDIAVVCGEPKFADDQKDTLLNPVLIAEVLSRSTEAADRGFKFREYRKIESLREYVLVSQAAPLLEVFVRAPEGDWILREFAGLDAVCHLNSIDCTIAVAEVYRNIPLENPAL
jgi:Uma2 family endonuclease